jgi:hypothetical protein
MSIWKEALRQLCKRKWRKCTSIGGAEPGDKASAVDDGGALEEDADVDDGGADADLCVSM